MISLQNEQQWWHFSALKVKTIANLVTITKYPKKIMHSSKVPTKILFINSTHGRSTTSELISPVVCSTCKSTSVTCVPLTFSNCTLIYRLNNMIGWLRAIFFECSVSQRGSLIYGMVLYLNLLVTPRDYCPHYKYKYT